MAPIIVTILDQIPALDEDLQLPKTRGVTGRVILLLVATLIPCTLLALWLDGF